MSNEFEVETDPAPATGALRQLTAAGVALWLDDLSRERLTTGNLAALVDELSIVGVTTNPTIFAAAVSGTDAYADQLASLAAEQVEATDAVWRVTTDDVRRAADVLRPVFDATGGEDGRVSIEVDPRLAHDAAGTVELATWLWTTIDRPNIHIKIPATIEGLEAITEVLAAGISVNVTLIFSIERYRAVLEAHAAGLERAIAAGRDITQVASVASFFVSRIDTAVDPLLDAIDTPVAQALRGTIALSNARAAFGVYQEFVATARWQDLATAGALPQRPLWASTGVKDPSLPDTLYVTELVTRGVVNTAPEKTLRAVADHGVVSGDTITGRLAQADAVLATLAKLGIDLGAVTDQLEREGLDKFVASWEQLIATVSDGLSAAQPAGD